MNSRGFITLIAALALFGAVVAPVGTVVAQETNDSTASTLPSENNTYVGQVDETLRIVDYEWTDGKMVVTLESDLPRLVVLSDMNGETGGEGVASIPQKRINLPSGTTTVEMDLRRDDGEVSLSLATSRGAVLVREQVSAIVFHSAATWGDVQAVAMIVPFGGLWAAFVVGNRIRDNKTPSTERKN